MCSEWLKAETVKRVKQNRNMHKSSCKKKTPNERNYFEEYCCKSQKIYNKNETLIYCVRKKCTD